MSLWQAWKEHDGINQGYEAVHKDRRAHLLQRRSSVGVGEHGHGDDVLLAQSFLDEVPLQEGLESSDAVSIRELEDLHCPLSVHRCGIELALVAVADEGSHRLWLLDVGDLDGAALELLRLRVAEHRSEDGRLGHEEGLVRWEGHAADLKAL